MSLYSPLPEGQYTRLLEVEPAYVDGIYQPELKARLLNVSLSEAEGTYTAISYVFGNVARTRSITISGEDLPITDNAHEAITRFRLPDRPIKLWNDLICIHQPDLAERGAQVQLMHEIFGKAERTVTWLGPVKDSSDEAMEFARSLDGMKMLKEYEQCLEFGM